MRLWPVHDVKETPPKFDAGRGLLNRIFAIVIG